MTAVLAQRTTTAVALAEQRRRAAALSPKLQPSPRPRPGHGPWSARPQPLARPLSHQLAGPLARLRRRAGMGMVTVGLRLALAGEDLDAA